MLTFAPMDEKLREIILSAMQVFLKLGFKNVSMDDMAKQLRVSKKTLYKYFTDKNDLVKQSISLGIEMDCLAISTCIDKTDNVIEELLNVTEYISIKMQQAHPSIFFELEKYYPESWAIFSEYRKIFTCTCMLENLDRGIAAGWYREELNTTVVAKFFLEILDSVFQQSQEVNQQMSFVELHRNAVMYHLHSITNTRGKTHLEKIINQRAN